MTLNAAARSGRSPVRADGGFRPDVQGLRAVAVAMVVVYHLWPSVLPGGFAGVDVFFVISGYLITGHLARGLGESGRVRLLDFWGRRARRLLPAVAVVLTVTWVVARRVLPATQLPNTVEQIRASALYFQNWVLARDQTDYLHSADAPSPVQHFWSLSVEEQFYLVWPFVFVVAALVAWRRGRRSGRVTALALCVAVLGASLWFSAHYTDVDPAAAYFVTTTRMWELALGGLLTLLPGRLVAGIARHGWAAWVGLAMVVSSAFVLSDSSPFPGTVALLPVGGAALLLACGSSSARLGPARLTSVRPLVFLGDISYSLYLWHWPLIVLWKAWSGGSIGVLDGPAIAAAAVLLAWLTKVFVEDPIRTAPAVTRRPWRSLATAATVLLPVTLVGLYTAPARFHGTIDAVHPGANVLAQGNPAAVHSTARATAPAAQHPIPPPAEAPNDFAPFTACETPILLVQPRPCTYGNPHGAKLRVALIGDSVAGQYRMILADAARKQHWFVVSDLHGQCPWTATMTSRPRTTGPYPQCHDWGQQVLHDMLTNYKPDVVVTSDRPVLGTPQHPTADRTSFGQIADGMVRYWNRLLAHGIQVVAVRESPEPGRNIPDCLTAPGRQPADCAAPAARAIVPDTPLVQAVARMHGRVDMIDLNSLICSGQTCPAILGNVVVYRDTHHLTQTFISSLEPYFMQKLLATRAVRSALRG